MVSCIVPERRRICKDDFDSAFVAVREHLGNPVWCV